MTKQCLPIGALRFALLVGALIGGVAPFAHAQSSLATRRVLLEQAQTAHSAGDFAHALDLAERAGQIEMTPSLQWFIAQQQEQLGHFAGAMGTAVSCVRDVEAIPNVANHDQILAQCREMGRSLRTRVGLVTVQVPASHPPGLTVLLNNQPIMDHLPQLWNVPSVVTPGVISVVARIGFAGGIPAAVAGWPR